MDDSTYIKNKAVKFTETESRTVVVQGLRGTEGGVVG